MSGKSGEASAFLAVLGQKPAHRRPVWLMRQAGRYLPEYREIRKTAGSFTGLCYNPVLAAEVTLQPAKRFDLDALIVFSDILVLPNAMGLSLTFREGEGPVLATVGSAEDVAALKPAEGAREVELICETLARSKAAAPRGLPVIGFCGAPWTVASYMIEGGSSDERLKARRIMLGDVPWFGDLMRLLVEQSVSFLAAQCAAGADALQIFDSWASDIPGHLQQRMVIEPMRQIRRGLKERGFSQPVIGFGRGLGAGQLALAQTGEFEAVGLETGFPPDEAARLLLPHCAVQGNLDPLLLAGGGPALDRAVEAITGALPLQRHIFNLGHGIRPDTDPAHVEQAIAAVRLHDGHAER